MQWPKEKMDKRTEQRFSKEEAQMPKKQWKKWSISLTIKEMNIKTMLRVHLTLVRMANSKNTNNKKYWQKCGERGTIIHAGWNVNLYNNDGIKYGGSSKN
jgi:hypothetical protein